MGFQQQFRQLLRILLIVFLAALVLMSISRGWFFLLAADFARVADLSQDVWRAFYIGLRFDAKVIALAFAPLLLSGLVMAASSRLFCWWRKLLPSYVGLIFFLLTAFSIGNYYYYVT
ncbi:LTA synthase family protein, partial [Vibrio parahaemolyticus]|nr:LTA synthase family protein [Vibrio parahaemolyticus]